MRKYWPLRSFYSKVTCPKDALSYLRRGAMFKDAVCTEISIRKLQKNYATIVCRCSLKPCKRNIICLNSTQKLLVQIKEFFRLTLQAGRFDLLCVERSSLQCHIKASVLLDEVLFCLEIPLMLPFSYFFSANQQE